MASFKFDGIDDVQNDLEDASTGIDDFECPLCGKPFRLGFGSETVTCPHCGETFEIEES